MSPQLPSPPPPTPPPARGRRAPLGIACALGACAALVAFAALGVAPGARADAPAAKGGDKDGGGKGDKGDKGDEGDKGDDKPRLPADAFTGISIAAHATDVYGPEAGFRISGWTSWGGANKLIELVPDGTEVKKGDQIARFDFQGKDALTWINERIAQAEAKAQRNKIDSQTTVDTLLLDKKKKELDARLAQIDVDKERALSKRQAEIYRITKKIADFEVGAIDKRIQSAQRANEAALAYEDMSLARARSDLDHYKFYEKRFVVYAPHDGVVRHAFNGHERRKVQKGDSVMSGSKVMSVAKDAALAARFFVPEHRIHELKIGDAVVVTTAQSAVQHRAVVSAIDYFPQEIGFLLDNNDLPNAREKAFAVKADFEDTPPDLTAGTELVVRPGAAAAAAPKGAP